jgi:hypothetical protein
MKATLITSLLLFTLFMVLPGSSFSATDSFTMSYMGQGSSGTCATAFDIRGREPSAPGTYPVFVYTVGTLESITSNGASDAAVAGMADRGFVAASVAYNTQNFAGCSGISGKARCIYDPTSQTSAITQLCSRAKADCSKGIVVGGFSQGSVIATLAKNFDSRVRAAWGMGEGVQYSTFDLRSCMANGNRALTSDRLRAVNGQADQFVSRNQNNGRNQARELTGFMCGANDFSCLQANGSGWYIVQNAEINGGNAEHCYMRMSRSNVFQCLGSAATVNDQWKNGAAPWSLNSNLDWLRSFTL